VHRIECAQPKPVETAHELGHAADFSFNDQSATAAYLTYVAADFEYLDYSQLGASAATSTPRTPCVNAGDPFTGLNDESTGDVFCVSVATNGYTLIPNSSPNALIHWAND
jgi:hypothetical protein